MTVIIGTNLLPVLERLKLAFVTFSRTFRPPVNRSDAFVGIKGFRLLHPSVLFLFYIKKKTSKILRAIIEYQYDSPLNTNLLLGYFWS